MGTVTVRGQAVVAGQPDEARVRLSIEDIRRTHAEAIAEVAGRSDRLEALLDELGIERSARTTSGVSVHEEKEYDGQAKRYFHRGFRASNSVTLRLSDPKLVGRVIGKAPGRAGAEVAGPYWQIALDNPVHARASAAAAGDAKRKAEAYASALGARLGSVAEVSEPGLRVARKEERIFAMTDAAAAPEPEPDIDIHTGSLDVYAAVEVTFNLEPAA